MATLVGGPLDGEIVSVSPDCAAIVCPGIDVADPDEQHTYRRTDTRDAKGCRIFLYVE